MTWTGRATAVPVTYTMALFDRPDGMPRGAQTDTIPDAIAEMFLVDPRAFTNQPYADPAMPVPPPATGCSSALNDWLREVQTGVAVNFGSTTNEDGFLNYEYDMCFRFGVGVRLEDSFGMLGAHAGPELSGADDPCFGIIRRCRRPHPRTHESL